MFTDRDFPTDHAVSRELNDIFGKAATESRQATGLYQWKSGHQSWRQADAHSARGISGIFPEDIALLVFVARIIAKDKHNAAEKCKISAPIMKKLDDLQLQWLFRDPSIPESQAMPAFWAGISDVKTNFYDRPRPATRRLQISPLARVEVTEPGEMEKMKRNFLELQKENEQLKKKMEELKKENEELKKLRAGDK